MESRIEGRVLSIIVAGAMIASIGTSWAATTKPTPKPTVKATKKATPFKSTPKATAISTKKPVVKKPAIKKTIAKKPTLKKKYTVYKRKVVKVSPSPSPKWPPSPNFTQGSGVNSEIYWRIPLGKELTSLSSADPSLASQFMKCLPNKYACGVIRVASVNGCTWWEINSTVHGPLSATDSSIVPYGTLRTTATATNRKQIITVLLISTEPLKPNVSVGGITINCHHDPIKEKIPSNVYTISTPSPTDTPTTNTN